MTKKERAYIQAQIEKFQQCHYQELKEAERASEPEDKQDHQHQADIYFTSFNTLDILLGELEEMK